MTSSKRLLQLSFVLMYLGGVLCGFFIGQQKGDEILQAIKPRNIKQSEVIYNER